MQAFSRELSGDLGRKTYVFENHYCVVDMPSHPGGFVSVLFTGVKNGKLATATVTVDTDSDPAKFQMVNVMGRELPKGALDPAFELLEDQVIQPYATSAGRAPLSVSSTPRRHFLSVANHALAAGAGSSSWPAVMEFSSGEQLSFEQRLSRGAGPAGIHPAPGIRAFMGELSGLPQTEDDLSQAPAAPAGAAANAPPRVVSGWPLGVDLYQGNPTDAAGFRNLKTRGKVFAIAKSSQGTARDGSFPDYYRWIRESGMIRGSFHFFANKWDGVPQSWLRGTIADQANAVIALVNRLGPGDLAPALDLEDEPWMPTGGAVPDGSPPGTGRYPIDQGLTNAQQGYHYRRGVYPNWQVGRDALLVDIQDFLDRVETALGRTPLIYTSHMWMDSDMMNNPQVLSQYPVWTVYHGGPDFSGISVGGWGRNWAFIQYAEQGKRYWGLNPYNEPGINIVGLDFDAYNGTIHGLRGLADLGHTAPHLLGNLNCIVYSEPDGRIHLLEYLGGGWRDEDVFGSPLAQGAGALPLAAGDPTAVGLGNEQAIVYRSTNDRIYSLTRTLTGPDPNWHVVDITGGGTAIGDPFVLLFGNNVHVVYWDQFNAQVHLIRVNGVWQATSLVDKVSPTTPSQISGSATAYAHQNVLHVVSRSRTDGHLFDFSTAPGIAVAPQDLTAASHGPGGVAVPGATYRPATYTPAGRAPRIVFRAVRGDVWQIERDTLNATNLRSIAVDAANAGGVAPIAAGSPTSIFADVPHVFYRTVGGSIIDLFGDTNGLRWRTVCIDAAADPTAFVDSLGHAALSFRATDGTIRVARLVNGKWACENATQR